MLKFFLTLALCCWLCLCAPPEQAFAAQSAESPRPVEIIDDSGATVRLAAPARRIIPLYAGLGETLAAMGLTDYVVGRTVSDDSLPAALPAVGTHMRPNIELVTALRPDLVLLLEGREEAGLTAEALARLGIPVARFRVASFADWFSCVSRLGALTGEPGKAEALETSMRERLDAVKAKTAGLERKPVIFFEVRYPNLLGAGKGSMPADIIRAAGGRNGLDDQDSRMVRLSEESLVLMNPDIYLIQEGAMNKSPAPLDERPHFRGLAAARNKLFFTVPESRFSRPGPQSVQAVEDLADIIMRWQAGNGQRPEPAVPAATKAE